MDIQQAPSGNTTQGIPAYDRFGAPTLVEPDADAASFEQPAANTTFGNDRIVRSGDAYDATDAEEGDGIDGGAEAAFSRGAVLYDEDDGSFAVIVPRNDWSAGTAPETDPAANDGLMGVRIVA